MSISLNKGGSVSLSKSAPGLRSIHVGLGWDVGAAEPSAASAEEEDDYDFKFEMESEPPQTSAVGGPSIDLDATVYLLTASGRVASDSEFVFYNNLASPCGSVRHLGDNRTGEGEGDDEVVQIDLTKVPSHVQAIRFCATIHDAQQRNQHFGMVKSAFIRVVNRDNGQEIARFDISRDAGRDASLVFGEVARQGGEWQFRAIGETRPGGLAELARGMGVNV
jgi:tellurium resistance protein TerD